MLVASPDPPFDGAPGWRVVRRLRDGTAVTIRPVLPEDREELRRGLLALSPQSRYFRFLQAVGEPTTELLDYLTLIDQRDHVALGATLESPDLKSERGIGIARFVRLPGTPDVAEAAITVADDMHDRGVGTVLLQELERAAEVRGVRRLRAEVLAENLTIRTILERVGAKIVDSGEGALAYEVTIAPRPPEPASPPKSDTSLIDVIRDAAESVGARFRR